ncbi:MULTISPECIES: histidine kinase dimerization/phosphoacceptor domain -containing protein [Hymenobacter]|uniref:histidine kinase n=1 Tax=Hymenobacter mucosus TaxID=1411120 RepID=A0A239AYC3_9BACT|nr:MULTISPECIES: histidine kinase dimerization/phosphoacceptor domain -containing protein [Hymenobacter]MDF7815512.1 histidine kinase dimerization/phosphoacceptor domain -containing protein [Hymenobacter sp. YC55]SNS00024.1 Two-component sensor histidine kinase, contains HisKA and HATPase domains [Hymenobacter mucosus]
MLSLRICTVLLLGLNVIAKGQQSSPAIRYEFRDYPIDSLRLLSRSTAVPDTFRVYCLSRLAVETSTNDLSGAISTAEEALKLAQKIGYRRGQMNILRTLANFNTESGNYDEALAYYQQGVDLATAQNQPVQLALLYLNMGATASTTGDAELSLKYLLRSYQNMKLSGTSRIGVEDSAIVFHNLGNTYFQLHRFDLARKFALKSVAMYRLIPKSLGAGQASLLMGRIYQQQAATRTNLDSASKYLHQTVGYAQRSGNPKEEAGALINVAELYQQQRNYPAMRDAAARCLELANRVGAIPFQGAASTLLAKAYAALGDYQQAYSYEVGATALNRVLEAQENKKALAQLHVKYDVQAREQQIKLLRQQARADAALVREQQQQKRALLGVASLLLLGLTAGTLLYWRLRRSRALLAKTNGLLASANAEIQESVTEKEVLVQEIHHRVKNNLQLVSSLLSWQSSASNDPTVTALMAGNQARIQSMALVHEFLYRAENLAQIRLDSYLAELLPALRLSLATPHRQIELSTDLAPVAMCAKDGSAFGLLVSEIVTNAYKHAFREQAAGHLHIALKGVSTKGFHLTVTDNGAGLPATGFEGQGLGMQIVRKLAKQLKATVTASPNVPTGTCIEIFHP